MSTFNLKEFYLKYERYILLFVIVLITALFTTYTLLKSDNVKTDDNEEVVEEMSQISEDEEVKKEDEVKTIFVDVKGEVEKPGVYEVIEGTRVIDAILLAGGLTKDADTTNVNLSKMLTDENVINVEKYESKLISSSSNNSSSNSSGVTSEDDSSVVVDYEGGLVNINEATIEELTSVSGIGEAKAKSIIEYRNEVGEFKTIEDILNVSGIGNSLYEKIKDFITV